MVYNVGFTHCLARSLPSLCPYYVPRLRWRRMRQRLTISKRGEGAPARKEGAYWGIYTLPDLVVSEEKTRIERETFDFSLAVLLCLSSSWSRGSSRGVVDTLLTLHSQKKGKDGGSLTFPQPSRSDRPSVINLGYLQLTFKTRWSFPLPSLIIIAYCSTVIRICEYSAMDCSRTGGPFYGGFAFIRLYLIAQSLGLFHRKPPEF